MRVYFESKEKHLRIQPWTDAEWSENSKYYDFRAHPELIPEVLEDFTPLKDYKSVQAFFDLIKWVNSDSSPFESNDCRIRPATRNKQRDLSDKKMVRHGAFMFFFRDLVLNLSADSRPWREKYDRYEISQDGFDNTPSTHINWLTQRSLVELDRCSSNLDTDFVGIVLSPVSYENAPVNPFEKLGHQIIYRFWVWGDDDNEIMNNFDHTVSSITKCLQTLANEMQRTT